MAACRCAFSLETKFYSEKSPLNLFVFSLLIILTSQQLSESVKNRGVLMQNFGDTVASRSGENRYSTAPVVERLPMQCWLQKCKSRRWRTPLGRDRFFWYEVWERFLPLRGLPGASARVCGMYSCSTAQCANKNFWPVPRLKWSSRRVSLMRALL